MADTFSWLSPETTLKYNRLKERVKLLINNSSLKWQYQNGCKRSRFLAFSLVSLPDHQSRLPLSLSLIVPIKLLDFSTILN